MRTFSCDIVSRCFHFIFFIVLYCIYAICTHTCIYDGYYDDGKVVLHKKQLLHIFGASAQYNNAAEFVHPKRRVNGKKFSVYMV